MFHLSWKVQIGVMVGEPLAAWVQETGAMLLMVDLATFTNTAFRPTIQILGNYF